jgi:hypothetical protein
MGHAFSWGGELGAFVPQLAVSKLTPQDDGFLER